MLALNWLKLMRGSLSKLFTTVACVCAAAYAQTPRAAFGPYNAHFVPDGLEYKSALKSSVGAQWSIYTWVLSDATPANTLIGGFHDTFLAIADGHVALWAGNGVSVSSHSTLPAATWHFLAASSDGTTVRLFMDGQEIGSGPAPTVASDAGVVIGPNKLPWDAGQHFAGSVYNFTVASHDTATSELQSLAARLPVSGLTEFDTPSHDWPVQTRGQAGYRSPQDPATLPKSNAPFSTPVAKPVTDPESRLEERGPNEWAILGGWRLIAAPQVNAAADQISTAEFDASHWLHATVPGTVLTTFIDRGIYPDPDFGLNNLAIPESLNKQDYWYRVEFTVPAKLRHKDFHLTFHGINYAASVWLNGKHLGEIRGAFIRGQFSAMSAILPGQKNVLAVRISPPPHPGIPQEQSVAAGPGENGGIECLDGPTFVATEGWDWIPGIRDRNTGIWQEVTLNASDGVRIGDPQVVTTLPLPDTSRADVFIAAPVQNDSDGDVEGTLEATFEGVSISKKFAARPGLSVVRLTPAEFPELEVEHPRLWWPNGYGDPALYHLNLRLRIEGHDSDTKSVRFGIREITYELSLLDSKGHLRRVEISPTEAGAQRVVDVMHEGMIQSSQGWVSSLAPGADNSPGVKPISDTSIAPYLAIKVNGVRIACKGGNWGMDDSRKRVSREHLEPFFRLHRDAHLNIIRNWVGQDTEEVFYDLADEYGLLVWNDFWDSTQNYNLEPDDAELFLRNAADVILRFRNHPSIVIWCGRNEGVPPPAINKGLDELIRALDGTRYYSPSSNQVNLQNSGPYRYETLSDYFTKFARGFAVELGIPSLPTIDAFKAFVAPVDQWPPNDVWAYHDWHASGNGIVAPFMRAIEEQFGAGKDLEDFERKAQILNYDAHRAIFEGFNAHLWHPNSGRMLWMTQPAWPSTMWQILSSDYDTQASFYGVKKATEPIHVQMNLPDLTLAVVNETEKPLQNVTVRVRVYSQSGDALYTHEEKMTAPAAAETDSFRLQLPEAAGNVVSFIKLELLDGSGNVLSDNFYTHVDQPETYQRLNDLQHISLQGSAKESVEGSMARIQVDLTNSGSTVAFMSKLTLRDAGGSRILPAYYSDNYVSLLPGEKRTITIEAPVTAARGSMSVGLTGWNITPTTVSVNH